ncbi:50S ribosomal protein L28 [Spiroplasma endosymbiont of Anurida maritima]|uniref:50S ribosomal protein L28 n=1 Tax=Spiroplasma endosymbiont of Anurida maritima TaxID=2967972 RepID=UPI0036D20E47
MSRKCAITGKGKLSGNNRSHALNATKRKWNVNLQKVNMFIDGKYKTVRISARTLRTLKRKGDIVA